jgi:membrane-associated protease RseP (regulator of RpoE activity)
VVEALAFLSGAIFLVLVLAVSIGLHELGHLLPAKRFGVRVKQYAIGFGPSIFSRRIGETDYSIKAIPLGGFISMIGMFPPERNESRGRLAAMVRDAREQHLGEMTDADVGREFYRLSTWRKLVVMLGGPVMNFLLGMVLVLIALVGIGTPQPTLSIERVSECLEPSGAAGSCSPQDPASPAAIAGLQAGDEIKSVAGQVVNSWPEAKAELERYQGETIQLGVMRDGAEIALSITPIWTERQVFDDAGFPLQDADGNPVTRLQPFLGIQLGSALTPTSPAQAFAFGIGATGAVFSLLVELPAALWNVVLSIFGLAERDPFGPVSILGVGQFAGQVAVADGLDPSSRIASALLIAASLNFALFAFNLIPLLPLDGGHVATALYEGTKRRALRLFGRPDPGPVDTARLLPLSYLVWAVLIIFGVLLILADVLNPILLLE